MRPTYSRPISNPTDCKEGTFIRVDGNKDTITHETTKNLVVLGILNDSVNLLDGAIDLRARTTNKDDVDRIMSSLRTNLNREGLLFADDTETRSE